LAALALAGTLLGAPLAAQAPPAPAPSSDPAAGKPIEYVEGRGVVFRTPDGLLEASLGFNLQVRFTHFDLDAAAGGADADEGRVRRFKLYLSGFAWSPRLTWRFQAAFENSGNSRLLDDAWLNYRFADALQLQGGQYKTPFTREELFNDGVLQFAERSIAVNSFKTSRDTGLMAQGSFGKELLTYQAGVFGGAGQSTSRATNHVMPVLRLVANPLGSMGQGEPDLQNHPTPALSVGANGFLNTLRKTSDTSFEGAGLDYTSAAGWLGRNVGLFETREDVRIKSWGFDAQFKWRGFFAQAEYLRGQAEGLTSGARLYAYGWYAQAGYCVLPGRLELATRYSFVDPNRETRHDNLSTATGGLNYYFHRHNLKLQLDYTRTHRQRADGAPANDQAVLVQAQLMP